MEEVATTPFDALCISGDISDGYRFVPALKEIHRCQLQKEIYFVLGNHDYYHSSIQATRDQAFALQKDLPNVHYLTRSEILPLTEKTAIVGHDSWADGGCGEFFSSSVSLRDFFAIEDFIDLSLQERFEKMQALGSEAAYTVKEKLWRACSEFSKVLFITHVPPFPEVCLYQGNRFDKEWGPFFVCQAMGQVLLEVAKEYPDCELLVLCGHSHHRAEAQICVNMRVLAGESVVGKPQVQRVIEF